MESLKSATHVENVVDLTATTGPFLAKVIDQKVVESEITPLLRSNVKGCAEGPSEKEVHYRNIDGKRFWLLFGTVIFGNTIAFFDSTLMASSHPVITSYFHASNAASWLSTVFYLTATITQPLYGRVSDVIGRRPVYLFSIAVFVLSTAWCALAQSIGSFIAARAVCGLGAGGVIAMSGIITSDIIKLEYRGIYQSYLNMAWGGGNGLGAAFGGFLCESLGWRAAFGIQLPFIFVYAFLAAVLTPENLGPNLAISQGKSVFEALKSFDFSGATTLTIALTCLILGINLGGNIFSWTHPLVLSAIVLFVVASIFVVLVERRATNPILPMDLLSKAPNSNLMWSNLLATVVTSTIIFNVSLFQQAVRQETATRAGLFLISPLVGVSLASLLAGIYITRTRRMKPMLLTGALCLLGGIIAVTILCSYTNIPSWAFILLISGGNIGQGFLFPATTIAALSLNAEDEQAVVTTSLGLLRNLGVILGVSTSSWILQNTLNVYLDKYVTGSEAAKHEIIRGVRTSIKTIKTLDPTAQAQVIRAYASALQWTFGFAIIFALVVLCLVLPIRLPRLQSRAEVEGESDSEDAVEDYTEQYGSMSDSETDSDSELERERRARRQSVASQRSQRSQRVWNRDRRPSIDAWSIS
jgi:MFS family permease